MSKTSKKWLKKRVDWFIDNKDRMGSYRRKVYLEGLYELYEEYLPYSKYEVGMRLMVEYINKKIRKRMKA